MTANTEDGGDDIVVTDKELFESAVSDAPASEPEPQGRETDGQPRDEHGRFATKTGEPPVSTEPPKTEPPATAAQTQQPPVTEPPKDQPENRVPLRELLDEREKRQSWESKYNSEIPALRQQVEHLSRLVGQQRQQPPVPPKDPAAPPPNLFEQPEEYLNTWAAPWVEALQGAGQRIDRVNHFWSHKFATEKHGEDAINAAAAELTTLVRSGQGQHEYQRIMSSPDPYGELMAWHNDVKVKREVGNDPKAWLDKQLEERMRDPAFQAKVLELARATATQQPPANGGRPNVQLPPSLSSVPAAAGREADAGSLNDEDLYRHAIAR